MTPSPDQVAVDFCAAKTMELLGELTLPEAKRFLAGFLILTPPDSAVIAPFRALHDCLGLAESKRQAIATGQLILDLGLEEAE